MIEEFIGYLAGVLIMISFIPQVIKSYKTKSVGDVSIWMILATVVGSIFWSAYGFMIGSMPVGIMNFIFLLVVTYQLHLKIKY
jgi:MtN3 and saliva related transmembrane protein